MLFIVKMMERPWGYKAALEEAGLVCNPVDGVIVISFDAMTRLGLQYCLEQKLH